MSEWFWLSKKEVLLKLGSGEEGLSSMEARDRLKEYGENVILEQKQTPWWQVFLGQFKDLLVMILIGAAGVSMVTGDAGSAGVIFAVLLLNALLGTIQNQKAQKSLESLKSLSAPQVRVRRGGVTMMAAASQVVPGDILLLEAGDRVGADGRILESRGLMINESSLTGESVSVEKQEELLWKTGEKWRRAVENPGSSSNPVPLADRVNMVFAGSLVTGGRGVAVVTDTGMNTELGKIALMMNGTREKKTPLQISLDRFSKRLAAAIMALSAVVFILGLYRKEAPLDALMFAVALAVAAIPEALSSIVTIVQAMGTQKMAKEHAIIKDLKAVESLGCVSVICSDKTGTLTQNRMQVEEIAVGGQVMRRPEAGGTAAGGAAGGTAAGGRPAGGYGGFQAPCAHPLLLAAALNNNGTWSAGSGAAKDQGDPMEAALLEMAFEGGVDPQLVRAACPRIQEWPFDSRRKRMSALCRMENGPFLLVKGAPDLLLGRCTRTAVAGVSGAVPRECGGDGDAQSECEGDGAIPKARHGSGAKTNLSFAVSSRPMTDSDRRLAREQMRAWASQGLRVLAFAFKPWTGEENQKDPDNELTFLGMAALMDPPRPESRAAVAAAGAAGIRTVMITGDHQETAAAIASRLGILKPGQQVVTGQELDEMGDGELERRLTGISVYARVSPEHKIRIVSAWQRLGRVVAMTGDGVNDAPALKKADIGVAMGLAGTEVSKEAASMVLADDNFATIIKAVSNGRNVYRNIKNAIQFLLSGNMAGIFCVIYTSLLALPMPFAPVHLLFINLLTDSLPAIAIGMEPAEEGLLKNPPRDPAEGILTVGFVRDILIQGGLIGAASLWSYRTGLSVGGEALASTMAFSTLTLARLFHGFNCRSSRSILSLGLFTNPYSVMAFEVGTILLLAVLFVPGLQVMFAAADMGLGQFFTVCFAAAVPTMMIQAFKTFKAGVE